MPMADDKQRLDSLQSWLASTHGTVLKTAMEIPEPAGTSPEWKAILDNFGVEPLSDQERAETVRNGTMARGAPLVEIQRVLSLLASNGTAALEKVDWSSDDPAVSRQWDRLRTTLINLVNDSMAAYKAKVLVKRSMFAMAKASMNNPEYQPKQQGSMAVLLLCSNCGGPRLTDGKFECDYCGTHFKD